MWLEGSIMQQKITQQTAAYKLDLSEPSRDGTFLCPKCGVVISPEDHSEAIYSIYDTIVTDNNLDELVIHCKRCLSFIHLTGFSGIQKTPHSMKPRELTKQKTPPTARPNTQNAKQTLSSPAGD
jgi:predicted RNA-binding Zn-ribbon protein involved in translation (DUF1610 family)